MSVFYILIPVSVALAAGFVVACLFAIRRGQFDDLDSPPWRILFDDRETAKKQPSSNHPENASGEGQHPRKSP